MTIRTESGAPSSALPIGKQRVLSPTRLTRVNPASPPSIHRLANAVLGLVMVSEDDKRTDLAPLPPKKTNVATKTAGVKKEEQETTGEVKKEDETGNGTGAVSSNGADTDVNVKTEEKPTEEQKAEEDNEDEDDEDEDEEQEPVWKEEIGWREVCGFLTM